MKLTLRVSAILMTLIWTAVLFGASTIDRTIAKLNEDILTESDLAEVVADVAGEFNPLKRTGYEGATSDSVRAMFDRALLLQEARRMKISPENEEIHRQVEGMVRDIRSNFSSQAEFHHALAEERLSLDQLKKELLDKTKTDYMVFHVVNSQFSVSEEEVAQFKQSAVSGGENIGSFRLRRLGIPVKGNASEAACREAQNLVAKIITEGISFEEGARRYSQVPGANADGGDMGYMAIDKLSAEVRAAVEKLEVGQASAPVVAGGFANIFYVEGKRGAQSAVREKRFHEAREQLLNTLRRKAILQVFDDRLMKIFPDEYRAALAGTTSISKSPRQQQSQSTSPVKDNASPQSQQVLYAPGSGQQPSQANVRDNQQRQSQPNPSGAQSSSSYAQPAQPAQQTQPQPRRWFGNRQ